MLGNNNVLIVAPHADDETLGCGGTILKLIDSGYMVHWLLVTGMSESAGYSADEIKKRSQEINIVAEQYGFASVHQLNLPPARLDSLAKGDIVGSISKVVSLIKPSSVYTVFRNDAHSDHEIVFDAVMSATKSFRYPFIKKILAYETISETDFGMKPESGGFKPNVFVDIGPYLEKKLGIMSVFESEIHEFPFPRSLKALAALAHLRGVQCNAVAAEAFVLIKEIQ